MTAERHDPDLGLMQRVASNEEGAMSDLYDRFGSLVFRMAYQMIPRKADAEDAVQEIFIRLWRSAGRYDPDRAALSTWVVLISRRFLVDRLRRARVRIKDTVALDEGWLPEINAAGSAASAGTAGGIGLDDRERFDALMKRIDDLPELQRTVVTRAYLRGQTLRQIGHELNRPVGTIKSTLSRALVRLREKTATEESAA